MAETKWLTTFYAEGLEWQAGHYDPPPLSIGEGFFDDRTGRRFRVVDIWHSTENHPPFEWGRHVFLVDVSNTDDDRLAQHEPAYFRDA